MTESKVLASPEVVVATASGAGPKHRSLRGDVWRQFRRHKGALVGLCAFLFVTVASFVGPYLMPYDGRPGQPRLTGFQIEEIQGYLQDLPTDRAVLILDTCFSGEGRSVSAPGTRSAAVIIEGPLVAPAGRAKGARTVVLASAGSQQVAHSLDTEGHGLFTYYLLSALRGQGDREPSGNGDGWVDVSEAFAYLSREVDRRSRREFGRPQNPEMHPAQISDPIRLTRVP